MANKTQPHDARVDEYVAQIEDDARRADAERLIELMTEVSGEPATMWGASIIGFGSYHYKYETGREGDAAAVGFSPRKAAHTIYLVGYNERRADAFERLGKHKLGKGCLYIKRLADVDESVLRDILASSVKDAAEIDAASRA